MKKITAVLLTFVMLFSLCACSNSAAKTGPGKVVCKYFDALKAYDSETMDSCFYNLPDDGTALDDAEIDMLIALYSGVKYEITDVKITDDNAVVYATVSKVDYAAAVSAATSDIMSKLNNGQLSSDDMDDDFFTSAVQVQLRKSDAERIERALEIDCVCIEDEWYISNGCTVLDEFICEGLNDIT